MAAVVRIRLLCAPADSGIAVVERDYFDRTLSTFQTQRPFRPFTVVLTSGDRLEIDHPEAVAHRNGRAVVFGPEGVMQIFDYLGVAQIVDDLMLQKTD